MSSFDIFPKNQSTSGDCYSNQKRTKKDTRQTISIVNIYIPNVIILKSVEPSHIICSEIFSELWYRIFHLLTFFV